MALADTAKLFVESVYKDGLSKGVANSIKNVDKLQGSVSRIGGIASKGFRTLGQNIKNIVTGPVGILGLGAGILGITKFLQDSVGKAREFGEAVFRVKAIIGGATSEVSQLVDVLGDYGIETDAIVRLGGMFEKNIGNIAKSAKTAAKFQAEFGVSVFDSTGKVKSFNEFLLESADIFTSKTIPQSQKAAILSKLYGRNWQELVPILSKGRAELEKTLGKGITLTDSQAKAMERARKAGIRWEDAIGDLQTMIGIELLPAITKFVNRMTNFIQSHGDEIRKFFRDAATFAEGMGRAIKTEVLPALKTIGDIWAGVPDDLKKILIGGFVLNKATGGAITGIVSELGKGLIKGVLGINAAVVNINAATVNGGAPGVPGGKTTPTGGTGIVGTALKATIIGFAGVALADLAVAVSGVNDPSHKDPVTGAIFRGTNVLSEKIENARNNIKALEQRAADGDAVAQRQLSQQKALLADLLTEERGISSGIDKQTGKMKDDQILRATTSVGRATNLTRASVLQAKAAIQTGTASTARNLDQVTSAIQRKKLAVNVRLSQRQRQAIAANIATGTRQGKAGFHYTKSQEHALDIDRVLASGAVGMTNGPMTALLGEAGREAYAILKNPRRGIIGGGAPPQVHVTVNIDPRRVTKKQTSSGIYKTYVAT